MNNKIIILLGPTATGKTAFGVKLAAKLNASIISADSRQIYIGLDIGTGKDISEYTLPNGIMIPHYLIDILPPDAPYSLAQFLHDASDAVRDIRIQKKQPLFVGGTALYLHGLVSQYQLAPGAPIPAERERLRKLSNQQLCEELLTINPDSKVPLREPDNRTRLIRAIEVAQSAGMPPTEMETPFPESDFLILGLYRTRHDIRERIRIRLEQRIHNGMIDEAVRMHDAGMSWERMDFLGLEYRYLALYLQGKLSLEEMTEQLYAKICQFAKRQDSWFRRFERDGHTIYWVKPNELDKALSLCNDFLANRTLPIPTFRLDEIKYPVKPGA